MNFELSQDQELMRETFARFLSEESTMERVRAALPSGFDQALWTGLAELGAFSLRVPQSAGGLGLGLLDAAVLMEEVGRTLASGPIAETLIAAALLAKLAPDAHSGLLEKVLAGRSVLSIAFRDLASDPTQWLSGGAIAEAIIGREGDKIVLIEVAPGDRQSEANLASTPIAQLHLGELKRTVLSTSGAGLKAFAQAIEEWKLLISVALTGLAREAIELAATYARERVAFGQPIGTYQGISHPLADLLCDVDGGKYLTWKTLRDIADGSPEAAAEISLTAWWNADTASRTVAQALHTFGGYGLTTEYDIHLYNLRAKAWPLIFGDPARFLEEAGRRLYAGETAALPDVGELSIDFDLGEEAHALAGELDTFFKENLTPELKAKAHYSFDGHDPGIHRKLAQAGLLFPGWPKEWGGRAAPAYALSATSPVWESHGWTGHVMGVSNMVGTIIRRFGTEQLKREVLTKIAAGEAICSLGYSEPRCGSDVFAAATRATRDGDGWRIDGQKMFTSGANISDYVLLLARTDPDVPKHKGLTMFIVPLKSPNVEIQAVYTFQDERTNITYYDGVRIPDSYRLGEVNGGVKVMAGALELEHGGGFGKTQLHMVRAAEDLCRELEFGGRPLIEDPAAQVRLARAMAHVLLSEVLAWRALWAGVEKKPNAGFGPMAKLFSSEKFREDAADLIALTAPDSLSKRKGPAGFLNQCYRHSQGTTIYGGTSEIHRSMIAERALNLPRTRT
ncbi:MAG: acyl-CoA dehydrogenase family protein [Sinobacteraceae bacterium]|nr:acyl-CoA dehydrogenase family protein [Nevskiaceae bacterium]